MTNSPTAVNAVIPLMKTLNMSWAEIKATPAVELEGLMLALNEYHILHSFDGYSEKDIQQMAKDKPEIRQDYNKFLLSRRKYGYVKSEKSFSALGKIKRVD
tara:strand:- start:1574 stop:1876 length:303 start_codon:yes stop_codon:yes gene_type:complete